MADTTELYTGAINEFVDWITGINKITGEHVDTELRQISGKSIRELLQNKIYYKHLKLKSILLTNAL